MVFIYSLLLRLTRASDPTEASLQSAVLTAANPCYLAQCLLAHSAVLASGGASFAERAHWGLRRQRGLHYGLHYV